MTYQRTTRDEWSIEGNYAQGWEEVCAEDTWKQARERLKEYRANEPTTAFRAVKHRIPLTQEQSQ